MTAVMQGQGRAIPPRDEAIKLSFRMINGDLETRAFLPTANVAHIKNVMAQVAVTTTWLCCCNLLLGCLIPAVLSSIDVITAMCE